MFMTKTAVTRARLQTRAKNIYPKGRACAVFREKRFRGVWAAGLQSSGGSVYEGAAGVLASLVAT